MAWIESHEGLEEHEKVVQLRLKMRWNENEVVGFLHRFWHRVLRHAPTGDLTDVKPVVMAGWLGMAPTVYRKAFALMLSPDVRLLERRGKRVLVRNWLKYAGRYLRDSHFRFNPEGWKELCRLYGKEADRRPRFGRDSADTSTFTSTNTLSPSNGAARTSTAEPATPGAAAPRRERKKVVARLVAP